MTRADIIKTRLTTYLHDDVEVLTSNPEPQWWWDNLTNLGPWAVLGFGMPVLVNGKVTVPFCPEVIAESCEDYPDTEFEPYIELLKTVITLYIVHMDIEDPDEWHDLVAMELGNETEVGLTEIAIQIELADFRYQISH